MGLSGWRCHLKVALLHQEGALRTFVIVLATGDEAMAALGSAAREHGLGASQFTAIGAFERAVVAYFDWPSKEYTRIPIDEQVEVLTLTGDIAMDGGKPKIHAHVVLGTRTGTARGGHLVEGHVRPTLEVMLTELPRHLHRRFDRESGLALIDPSAGA